MSIPRVSIIVPTFNRSGLLQICLNSMLSVTVDCEILVLDNASTDDTEQVCSAHYKVEPRLRYIRNAENIGPVANFNLGLREARGEYLCMIGDDDIVLPGNFEKKISVLDAAKDIGLVYSLWYRMDELGNSLGVCWWPGLLNYPYIGGRAEFFDLLPASYIMLQSVLFRRGLFEEHGGFDPSISLAGDWDLLLRYCAASNTAFLNDALVAVRVHSESSTQKNQGKGQFARDRLAVWRKWLVDNKQPPVLDELLWGRLQQAFLPDLSWEFGQDQSAIQYFMLEVAKIKQESQVAVAQRVLDLLATPRV